MKTNASVLQPTPSSAIDGQGGGGPVAPPQPVQVVTATEVQATQVQGSVVVEGHQPLRGHATAAQSLEVCKSRPFAAIAMILSMFHEDPAT